MLVKKKTAKKTIKKEPVQPKRLYLNYTEKQSGGGICEGQENENWPLYEDTYITVNFHNFCREPVDGKFFQQSFEVSDEIYNLNQAYLAIIRFYDGGTFGKTYGYWHVVGIFKKQKEAKLAIKNALDKSGHKPWVGYFAGFESEEIYLLLIGD